MGIHDRFPARASEFESPLGKAYNIMVGNPVSCRASRITRVDRTYLFTTPCVVAASSLDRFIVLVVHASTRSFGRRRRRRRCGSALRQTLGLDAEACARECHGKVGPRASLNTSLGRIARSNVHAMKDVCLRVTLSRESRALPRARACVCSRSVSGIVVRRFFQTRFPFSRRTSSGGLTDPRVFSRVVNRHGRFFFEISSRSFPLVFF